MQFSLLAVFFCGFLFSLQTAFAESPKSLNQKDAQKILKDVDATVREAKIVLDHTEKHSKSAPMKGKFRVVNKMTSEQKTVTLATKKKMNYQSLILTLHACIQRPISANSDKLLESLALLEVNETIAGEKAKTIFSGWMFSESPSLNPLEHPAYDITLISCAAAN